MEGGITSCKGLGELKSYYDNKSSELEKSTALMAQFSDISTITDENRDLLNSICGDLGKMQKLLAELESHKTDLRHTIECNKVISQRLEVTRDQLKEQNSNIPKHMPHTTVSEAVSKLKHPEPVSHKRDRESSEDLSPTEKQRVRFEKDAAPPKSGGIRVPSKVKISKVKVKKTPVPPINPLTMDEYNSVPKYMLGRVKYAEINHLINELNGITAAKYKIMDTPRNKLSSENMRRYTRMTAKPETKETLNLVWFEEQDLRDLGVSPNLAHTFNKMKMILTHCHRLRQFRAGKIDKYIVVLNNS